MWVQGHRNYDALCKHGRKNNYIFIPSSLSHVYVHYEDTRLWEITLLPMRWSDVVWRWLLCRYLYTMCILRELATALSVQVTSVRRWDWSNTVQNAYRMVSLHGAIVKITENWVVVNVYLQELFTSLFTRITRIYRIQRRRNGILEDTSIHILTFDSCQLPDKVHIGWIACSVRECSETKEMLLMTTFWSWQKTCRTRDGICYNCSEPTYDLPCTRPTKYPNYDQPHSANNNKCFYCMLKLEILTTQIIEKISYVDAMIKVNNRYDKPDQSYSAAVSNQKQAYTGNTQSHPSTMTSLRGAPARGLRQGNSTPAHLFICNYLSIRDTPTKLLKHVISKTFTFLISALLIPRASAPYNAVGTITGSYRHFLAFIPNPLLLSTLFSAPHSLYPSFILCTTSLSHLPSAVSYDPRNLKQSTSSIGWPFSITHITNPSELKWFGRTMLRWPWVMQYILSTQD